MHGRNHHVGAHVMSVRPCEPQSLTSELALGIISGDRLQLSDELAIMLPPTNYAQNYASIIGKALMVVTKAGMYIHVVVSPSQKSLGTKMTTASFWGILLDSLVREALLWEGIATGSIFVSMLWWGFL